MNLNQLNDNYGIHDQVHFVTGNGGLPFIDVRNQSACALISLYGGQLLSFKPVNEKTDMLFISKKALYEEGKAIRGGIPVCWPWFGPDPKGLQRPNHGFVRNHFWTVAGVTSTDSATKISLQFTDQHIKEKTWQQPFTLILEFIIAQSLSLNLIIENTGEKPLTVTQAFHTYFNVGDICRVGVSGLDGRTYVDQLDNGKEKIQTGLVTITEAIERIYQNVDRPLLIHDSALNRRIEITSENCKTGIVWNPWQKAMPDLEQQEYQRFVCVETGNVAANFILVPPGGKQNSVTSFKVLPD
jgi:glucose-6-phosphate 1-epimerase